MLKVLHGVSFAADIDTGAIYIIDACGTATKLTDGLIVSSIAIITPPTKTTYVSGESFDPVGMVVKATYTDGSVSEIATCAYTPNGRLATTDTKVTIMYGGKTAEQAITVTAASTLCAITAFHLNGDPGEGVSPYSADGVIDDGTIVCTFTDTNAVAPMPNLAATWTASQHAVITVNGVVQVPGTSDGTYNDFNDGALEFVVTAQDGVTTKTYTVTAVPYTAG